MAPKYRILTEDRRIKFIGTEKGSWFTLDRAKELVDQSKGEMIYEYNENQAFMGSTLILKQ